MASGYIDFNNAFDTLYNAVNETNYGLSSNLRAAQKSLTQVAEKFPFEKLQNSSETKVMIKKVKDLLSESIIKIERSVDILYNKTGNDVPAADDSVLRLANATEEMKTFIREADYDCSKSHIPEIIPILLIYQRQMISMPKYIIIAIDDFYGASYQATNKSVELISSLTQALSNCAVDESKQECMNQFVSRQPFFDKDHEIF